MFLLSIYGFFSTVAEIFTMMFSTLGTVIFYAVAAAFWFYVLRALRNFSKNHQYK